jgi:hypothetical protein
MYTAHSKIAGNEHMPLIADSYSIDFNTIVGEKL